MVEDPLGMLILLLGLALELGFCVASEAFVLEPGLGVTTGMSAFSAGA